MSTGLLRDAEGVVNRVSAWKLLYRDTVGGVTYTSATNASSTGGAWATMGISSSSLTTTNAWNTPGQTAVIYLRVGSKSSNIVRLGDITLNYLSKW